MSTRKQRPRSTTRKKVSLQRQTVKDLAPGKGQKAAGGAVQTTSRAISCGAICEVKRRI